MVSRNCASSASVTGCSSSKSRTESSDPFFFCSCLDSFVLLYLAEVTMSIMQKQKSRDPRAGYARDFVPLMEHILPNIIQRGN